MDAWVKPLANTWDDTATATERLILNVLADFAELEHSLIKEGRERARRLRTANQQKLKHNQKAKPALPF